MNPAARALWFIEANFVRDLTLDEIAGVGGVSRYHMSRAFALATGHSIQRYMRGRRLAQAARSLANGAPDILTVALDSGYGSHEAFTRAFRDELGTTPESVRAQGHIHNLNLLEPIKMDETPTKLDPPRFENGRPLLIAGLSERFDDQTIANVPALWQRFAPNIGHIPGQVGNVTYGVCHNADDSGRIDYVAGVEVRDFDAVPEKFSNVRVPAHRYAVFTHRDHISAIRRTWQTIFNSWLPQSGYELDDAPELERYDERFDPRTGNGELEIWIPVKKSNGK